MDTQQIPSAWTIDRREDGIAIFDENGTPRCGGKRSDGGACRQHPRKGRYRCGRHGGATPRGLESPHYKTGEHSRYFTGRIASVIKQISEQGDLNDLSENIALLDVRLLELARGIEYNDFQSNLDALQTLYADGTKAINEGDMKTFSVIWRRLGKSIQDGQDLNVAWNEAIKVNNERIRATQTKANIEYRREQALSVNELVDLLNRILNAFNIANSLSTPTERKTAFRNKISTLIDIRDIS